MLSSSAGSMLRAAGTLSPFGFAIGGGGGLSAFGADGAIFFKTLGAVSVATTGFSEPVCS